MSNLLAICFLFTHPEATEQNEHFLYPLSGFPISGAARQHLKFIKTTALVKPKQWKMTEVMAAEEARVKCPYTL